MIETIPFCRRLVLKALKNMGVMGFLLLSVMFAGCDDETVAPPPPPPQISLEIYNFPTLPDNDVFDVLVDSQDRIWFCTQNGVTMKDGNTINIFQQAQGLINPKTRAVVEYNDWIWIGTWGSGLAVYDGAKWFNLSVEDGLINDLIFDLAVYDQSLWICTVSGISQYTDDEGIPMSNRWTNQTNKVRDPQVSSIEIAEQTVRGDEIWFGQKIAWLSVWRPTTFQGVHFEPSSSGIPGTGVNDVAYNPVDGKFWVAFATEGLASVDIENRTWRHYTTQDGLPSNIVHSVAIDQNGVVWAGTQKGVGKQSGSSFIGFIKGSGLPEERVRKVYVDPHNRVWLGFIGGGAARVLN
jgi:ligand-binding sensor domain-containing protein